MTVQMVRETKAKRYLDAWCQLVDAEFILYRHTQKLIEALEAVERGETLRLMVFMPPRLGKSLTSSIRFPGWYLGRNPDKRVITASHTVQLADTFSRQCRNELSEWGPKVFDVAVAQDSSAMGRWDLRDRRGGMFAVGVGGAPAGRGADLLDIDDPVRNAEDAESEARRIATVEWYRKDIRTRLAPRAAIVIIQTRWHERDLSGWLLDEMKRGDGESWEVLSLPMLNDAGEALCPEMYDAAACEELKRSVGSRAWESLYQQRPTPTEGAIFKRDWFKRYKRSEAPGGWDEVVLSWDMAFKGTDGSDFVAGQVWGRSGARKYLLERVHRRMDFPATLAAFEAQAARWPDATAKLIEDAANGPAVIQSLRTKIPGIIPVKPNGSKEARAHAVTPTCEAGDVYLPDEPWADELLSELCSFPNGAHDDEVDAMTQALNRLQRWSASAVVAPPKRRERGSAVTM